MIAICSVVLTYLALPLVFPELTSYYGGPLQAAYQDVGEWFSALDPRWIYVPLGYVLGVGSLLFGGWVFVEWQDKWKKALWEDRKVVRRAGLQQFKRAPRQIGRLTVRYGIVQDGATAKERWFDSRRVGKGKEVRVLFPESERRGGTLCFLEFPDSYEVTFLADSRRHYWSEYNSPTPGYRRYAANLPLSNQTALFIVGTDDQGTGGWSAAWKDLWYGSKAMLSGVSREYQTAQQNTKLQQKQSLSVNFRLPESNLEYDTESTGAVPQARVDSYRTFHDISR